MNAKRSRETWRRWAYRNLHSDAWHKYGLSPLNQVIAALILAAVALAIIQTEPDITAEYGRLMRRTEVGFGCIFLVEYLARLWIAPEIPELGGAWRARLRYALTWPAIIDLIALASLFATVLGAQGAFLRLFRLVRLVMLARLGQYSSALKAVTHAIATRRYELGASLTIAVLLLIISSTLLYLIEGSVQPDKFGSIPRSMWWAIATLTTVGYGDAYPITPLGKVVAGMTALMGIGLIAMPTGILAAAFSEAIHQQRDARVLARQAKLAEAQASGKPEPPKDN